MGCIFKQAGFALHGLLAEFGVDAEVFMGPQSHCGWWNRHALKMFKGFMKGKCKGKGWGRCHRPRVVICDGCGACPLKKHFRSQWWSNFDLCETCYASMDKEQ